MMLYEVNLIYNKGSTAVFTFAEYHVKILRAS